MSLLPKEEAVLKLLEEDTAYKDYFFNKVADPKWFEELKKREYFHPKNAPGPRPGDQEGYYSMPWWNVLSYLEKVSEQLHVTGNEKYIAELLAIIKEVSTYKVADGTNIDNFHTWRSFVTILLNIPKEKIPLDIIELSPIWLNSKFDVSHVGSEIGLKLLPKFLSEDPTGDDIAKAEGIVSYITDIQDIAILPSPEFISDSFPASLALFYSLKKLGKNVNLISQNYPEKYNFLVKEKLQPQKADFLIAINQDNIDISQVSYEKMLSVFWRNIDPTTENRQFVDIGPQYRTAIFYHNEMQKTLAETSKKELDSSGRFEKKIVTEIVPASKFYQAEMYHQDYYRKHPVQYQYYRIGSGRDQYKERVWGKGLY